MTGKVYKFTKNGVIFQISVKSWQQQIFCGFLHILLLSLTSNNNGWKIQICQQKF